MPDKTFRVLLKPPSGAIQHVSASRFEIQGKHLVFLDSKGGLAALFLMEIVESWSEIAATKPGLARSERCDFLDP
jgi:hypothetical protein